MRKGRKLSEETRRKMSEVRTGKMQTETSRQKIRLAMLGNKHTFGHKLSDAHKKKISIAHVGIHHSELTKEKLRLKNIGKKALEETRYKMSIAHTGKELSDAHKRKIGIGNWKGGKRLSTMRQHAKRKMLGHDALNEPFNGSEGHHIDHVHILYIPRELHRSINHSLKKPEKMEQINTKAYCWLLGKSR